ncbi:MAG TPA: ABC transporter permease [Verrucomicrobiae bacterium]|jgi:putative ABC transport system permease protein|nr:ABC transporter permease [Verrucomicrobiae bacterium]
MSLLPTMFGGLRSLLRKKRVAKELDEELRGFLDMAAEEKMKQGMSREEAFRSTRLERGSLEVSREIVRSSGWESIVETCWRDLRYGLRVLRKSPGFAVVAVLTLALGIGATTAIFSIVNAVLLRPLAMEDPSHVVFVQETWRDIFPGVAVGNFADLKRQSTSFAELCASSDASFNLEARELPERVDGEIATANYFTTFGVRPIAGRVFTADEDKLGQPHVVVISERLWRTKLHADPSIVGQPIRINGLPTTVLGVMPGSFDPLLRISDLWVPAAFSPEQLADHDNHYLNVIARLKPGTSQAQAQSQLNVIAQRLQQQYPIDDQDRGFRLQPLAMALLGDQRLALRMMLAAVGFLLLIACANIANLQLARSRTRQKEIAMRAALGAPPSRIVRQLLAENVVLGLAGGGGGVLLAYWAVIWIVAHGPAEMPRLDQSRIDAGTIAFACAIALLSSFLFGLAPALRSASTRLSEVFKSSSGISGGSRDCVRSLLVVGEVSLALILMAGAGLLIRSALLVSHLDPGFDTSNVVVGRIGLPDPGYHDPALARLTFERIITATALLPGVKSVAVVSRAPLAGGGSSNGLLAEGKPFDMANLVNSQLQIISPSYLSTARVPLKAGRDFTPQDARDRTLVTIVNETLARTMWSGENPIGKRFACCEAGAKGRTDPVWHEVVGVVADVRAWGLDRQVQPEFYIPLAQMPTSAWDWIGRTMDLVVRTRAGAVPIHELQGAVASVAPAVPIYRLSTMQQKISSTLERPHFDTFLLTIFATTALLLSSVGIYGVLSYLVAQRTRDIGVRMALGASQAQIVWDVLGFGVRLAAIGLAVGLAAALAATRLLSSLLYGVGPTDAVTFAVVSFILLVVALIASYLPARRATRVDPLVALRYE